MSENKELDEKTKLKLGETKAATDCILNILEQYNDNIKKIDPASENNQVQLLANVVVNIGMNDNLIFRCIDQGKRVVEEILRQQKEEQGQKEEKKNEKHEPPTEGRA